MSETYHKRTVNRTAMPRSERLRRLGTAAATSVSSLRQQGEVMAPDWFTVAEVDGEATLVLNPRYAGLWAEGWISAGGGSPRAGLTLGNLSDVDLETSRPANGQALVYDNGVWVPGSVAAGGGQLFFGPCQSTSSTPGKVVTCPDFAASNIAEGTTIIVFMAYGNTVANPTLNINNTGAVPILRQSVTAQYSQSLAYWWGATEMVQFIYHGEGWMIGGGKIAATNTAYGVVRLLTTVSELQNNRYSYGCTASAALLYEIYTNAGSGGGGTPVDLSNYVTLNTTQTISGAKTFTASELIAKTIRPSTSGAVTINSSSGEMTALGNGYDLGSEAYPYRAIHTKVIYLGKNGNDDVYVYYDTVNKCVRVHGAGIATDSFVTAGGIA